MKKTILSLILTIVFAFVFGSFVNAQTGDCDVVLDFEDGSTLPFHNLTSVTGNVDNPYTTGINNSSKVLRIKSTDGYNFKAVYFQVTLPAGKTFAEIFTTIKFQVAAVNNDIYGKPTCVGVSDNGTTWNNIQDGLSPNDNFGTAWVERTVSVSALNDNTKNKTGTFYLGVGVRQDEVNNEFYLDNIVLVANPDECIVIPENVFTVTLNPGTGTCAFPSITETEEGAGVTLPTATPSAKCALGEYGYTFAGWATESVDPTEVAPDMLPAGAWAISDNTTLYAVYTDGTVYETNPRCSASLNGTVIDGYLIVEDFEGETASIGHQIIGGNGSGTTEINANPNGIENSLLVTYGDNYNQWLQLSITLPPNKSLNDYESLYFDIYYGQQGDNTYKDVKYSFNNGSEIDIDKTQNNLGVWKTLSIAVDGLAIGNSFTFEVGYNAQKGANFRIDNIKLTGAEDPIPEQLDWVNLQWPGSGEITLGGSYDVYGQVYHPGITDVSEDASEDIQAWAGYSTTDTHPNTWTNWVETSYNGKSGNNHEYKLDLGAEIDTPGTYYYAFRYKFGDAEYVYGGFNDDGDNNGGFWGDGNVSGVLTVNRDTSKDIDWGNVQWPTEGSIFLGEVFVVYGQVNKDGVTTKEASDEKLKAWIGFTTDYTTIPADWNEGAWSVAEFNESGKGEFGNNHEYKFNLASVITTAGEYYYVYRYQYDGGMYYYGGIDNKEWNTTDKNFGELIVAELTAPVAQQPSGNLFLNVEANWSKVAGVDGYILSVYQKDESENITQVSGSPVTVTDADNEDPNSAGENFTYTFTGLKRTTEYYYSVIAYKGALQSPASNEIPFTTGPLTDVEQTLTSKAIYAHNEKVFVNTIAGESIDVFNIAGQKISTTIAQEGLNVIPVNYSGIILVKVGDKVAKLSL